MKTNNHTISPYPESVRIKNIQGGAQVFNGSRFVGEVQKVQNWGADWLARPENGQPNKFHATKTEAVQYLIARAAIALATGNGGAK